MGVPLVVLPEITFDENEVSVPPPAVSTPVPLCVIADALREHAGAGRRRCWWAESALRRADGSTDRTMQFTRSVEPEGPNGYCTDTVVIVPLVSVSLPDRMLDAKEVKVPPAAVCNPVVF